MQRLTRALAVCVVAAMAAGCVSTHPVAVTVVDSADERPLAGCRVEVWQGTRTWLGAGGCRSPFTYVPDLQVCLTDAEGRCTVDVPDDGSGARLRVAVATGSEAGDGDGFVDVLSKPWRQIAHESGGGPSVRAVVLRVPVAKQPE